MSSNPGSENQIGDSGLNSSRRVRRTLRSMGSIPAKRLPNAGYWRSR